MPDDRTPPPVPRSTPTTSTTGAARFHDEPVGRTAPPVPPAALATADMRVEVVKREVNQGALAGFDSAITDYAARCIIAALDSFDEAALAMEFRRGFELGEQNARLLLADEIRAGVAAGRKQAAADIREHVERWENSPNVFTKELEAMRAAARIAEEPNHVD